MKKKSLPIRLLDLLVNGILAVLASLHLNTPNRIVIALGPAFAIASGYLTATVAKLIPGVQLDPLEVAGLFATGAALTTTKLLMWLKGWQAHENSLSTPPNPRKRVDLMPVPKNTAGVMVSGPSADVEGIAAAIARTRPLATESLGGTVLEFSAPVTERPSSTATITGEAAERALLGADDVPPSSGPAQEPPHEVGLPG